MTNTAAAPPEVRTIAEHDGRSPNDPHPPWWAAERLDVVRGRLWLVDFDVNHGSRERRRLITDAEALPEWLDDTQLTDALDILEGPPPAMRTLDEVDEVLRALRRARAELNAAEPLVLALQARRRAAAAEAPK